MFEAYYAALAADAAFSLELVRVYGANARNARYYYKHADAAVQAAANAKLAADAAYRATLNT